jgi:exosortase D (VPLPA-CTERM-specific)
MVFAGLLLYLMGELSTLYVIVQYAFVIVVVGLVWAFVGHEGMKLVAIPLFILFFMVPLPNFIYFNLSANLQLLSSLIGVELIRMFGISVFLSGNVIDLGSYKLQVVEACNGLRYLFPLVTLGFIVAYFYKAELWKRIIIVLSTFPITVFMNSFRIGVIGVMVEHWGPTMADGFLHDFEGWVIFMACFGILFLEMWVLNRLSGSSLTLQQAFGLEFPAPTPKNAALMNRRIPKAFIAAAILLAVIVVLAKSLPQRVEATPARQDFSSFPLRIGDWAGEREQMEKVYIDALLFSDYLLANYRRADESPINFYVAYYDSQRKGQSAHSPRTCLPGGGWEMTELNEHIIEGVTVNGHPLQVNRTLIKLGDQSQLVYYWFQQRGRIITNEYLVKWFLFWDALTKNRSDGALVRITTPLRPGETGDDRLEQFAKDALNELHQYVPN